MLFNSFTFLFLFLPGTLAAFYLARSRSGPRAALFVLVAASVAFYGWWSPPHVFLLAGSAFANYAVGRWLMAMSVQRHRWWLTAAAIAANLALIGWFKYSGFFGELSRSMFGLDLHLAPLILPLAISFFTFEQIAFLVEVYKRNVQSVKFGQYLLFVSFFPHLIAGPIIQFRDFVAQLEPAARLRANREQAVLGTVLIVIGLVKKVVIADSVGVYAEPLFAADYPVSLIEAWGGALAFTFQIYFDFSAYSDIAIGLAAWFGIVLPTNFDSPYKARSLVEFWRRWHITLTWFLRTYLYIPLGGNRAGEVRRYMNVIVVMLLGGLWHGASVTMLFWGGLHGVGIVVVRLWQRGFAGRYTAPGWLLTSHVLTFVFVVVAWVPFRATSVAQALDLWGAMFDPTRIALPSAYLDALGDLGSSLAGLGVETLDRAFLFAGPEQAVVLAVLLVVVLAAPNSQQIAQRVTNVVVGAVGAIDLTPLRAAAAIVTGVLLAIAAAGMLGGSADFVYFQF